MPYKDYSAEDLVLDQEFRNWVLNPDADSNQYWKELLDNNPDKSDAFKSAIELIHSLPVQEHKLSEEEISSITRKIEESIDNLGKGRSKNEQKIIPINPLAMALEKRHGQSKFGYFGIFRIAASILLVMGLSYLFYHLKDSIPKTQTIIAAEIITKENPKGQKSTIFLKDGSKIILNANSKITYSKPFDQNKREVLLEGEAFFEVAEDKNRPFEVTTGQIITTALGTSFNIRAYPKNNQVKISLATGRVKIDQKSDSKSIHFLEPGEELSFSPVSGYTKTLFNSEEVLAWTEGIIHFKNADAEMVISKLERWYGVDIETRNESSRRWNVTARFNNQSLENVLRSLSFSEKFEYSINEKNIVINY